MREEDAEAPDVPLPPPDVPLSCPEGATCDDDDPCTLDDRCDAEGVCAGTPRVCDDGRACTEDRCDETGSCAARLADGWCLIDAVCREAGAAAPATPCLVCDPAVDGARWSEDDDATCDDGDACTLDDHCDGGGCVASEVVVCPPDETCVAYACDAATGGCPGSPRAGGCDDGDACTTGDRCVEGACAGDPLVCEVDSFCLVASCDPALGCVETPVGGACEDGDACTLGDTCVEGSCVPGDPPDCDDDNSCTTDSCHPLLGCDHVAVDSACCVDGLPACDDGNPCTQDDCTADGACTNLPFVGPCDDGDACTGDDACDELGACAGGPLDCDDGNPCTTDGCDVWLGCRHAPAEGACDDGDPCTSGDRCHNGRCIGVPVDCDDGVDCTLDRCDESGSCQHELTAGLLCDDGDACTRDDVCDAAGACDGEPLACDDGNDCTDDACDAATGCVYTPNALACDDGDECTTDDACVGGACAGTPGGCACQPELAEVVNKVTSLAIGDAGVPGSGLDVDGDPTTCQPQVTGCSGGVDNSMAGLAGLANAPLGQAVADGSVMLLFEHLDFASDGSPYVLALLTGDVDDPAGCDFQTETCAYLAEPASFDEETCAPLIVFDNATLVGTDFDAGGPGYTFPFQIPFQGLELAVEIFNARIVGTATLEGDDLVALDGIIGGAVPKQQLIDAVNALPDEVFEQIGFTKDFVLQMLGILIQDDIDTNGDDVPDAASIGIIFSAIDGTLTGVAP